MSFRFPWNQSVDNTYFDDFSVDLRDVSIVYILLQIHRCKMTIDIKVVAESTNWEEIQDGQVASIRSMTDETVFWMGFKDGRLAAFKGIPNILKSKGLKHTADATFETIIGQAMSLGLDFQEVLKSVGLDVISYLLDNRSVEGYVELSQESLGMKMEIPVSITNLLVQSIANHQDELELLRWYSQKINMPFVWPTFAFNISEFSLPLEYLKFYQQNQGAENFQSCVPKPNQVSIQWKLLDVLIRLGMVHIQEPETVDSDQSSDVTFGAFEEVNETWYFDEDMDEESLEIEPISMQSNVESQVQNSPQDSQKSSENRSSHFQRGSHRRRERRTRRETATPKSTEKVFQNTETQDLYQQLQTWQKMPAYQIFELTAPNEVNDATIDPKFREMSKQFHPDLYQGNNAEYKEILTEVFALLNDKYEELKDEETRTELRKRLDAQKHGLKYVTEEEAKKAEVLQAQGRFFARKRNYTEAKGVLETATALDPYNWRASTLLAITQAELGERSKIEVAELLSGNKDARGADRLELLFQAGEYFLQSDKEKEAYEMFNKVIELEPSHIQAKRYINQKKTKPSTPESNATKTGLFGRLFGKGK